MNWIPAYVTRQSEEVRDLSRADRRDVDHGLWLCQDLKEITHFIANFNKALNRRKYYDFDVPRRIYVNEDMWNLIVRNSKDKVQFLFQFPEGFHKRLPRYVMMGGLALRHSNGGMEWGDYGMYEVPSTYFRAAGHWRVEYEWRNGQLFSVSDMESLNDRLLVETTREKWLESNEGYV